MIKNKRKFYDLIVEGYEKEYDSRNYIQDEPIVTNPFTVEEPVVEIKPVEDYEDSYAEEDETDDILSDISDKLDTLIDVILSDNDEDYYDSDDEETEDEAIIVIEDDEDECEDEEDCDCDCEDECECEKCKKKHESEEDEDLEDTF